MRASLLGILAISLSTSFASADYEMPPIEEVVKTVPLIVDATVTRIDPKTGNTHLKIHRVIRGTIDSKRPVVTRVALTCTPDIGPGKFGVLADKRYIFLLESEEVLFEETTYFEVTGDPKKIDDLRIRYPRHYGKGEAPEVTFEEFAKRIVPPAPRDSK